MPKQGYFKPLNKYGYSWECPIEGCEACSRKSLSHVNALRHGRYHLKLKHAIWGMDPIVKRIQRDESYHE